MTSIKDLDLLLKSLRPELVPGQFVFSSISAEDYKRWDAAPVMVFSEPEGLAIIVEKNVADAHSLPYQGTWAMITLAVDSDLSAVGFLAAITGKLAERQISVNAVSALHHDHLFVPYGSANDAMQALLEL